ncbi:MAG: hypothetical protein JSS72_11110 [Armatimonadetes bacterium]|nr:hypothetical protein [Armatimonadota bacterium]
MKPLLYAFFSALVAFSRAADLPANYDLKLAIEPDQRSLAVTAKVALPSKATATPEISFLLIEQMTDVEAEVLEPRECAGKAQLTKLGSQSGETGWSLKPATPFPAGVTPVIRFTYHGGEKTQFVFHIGPEGCFAGGGNAAWYPQFGDVSLKDGKLTSDTTDRGIGHIRMTVPAGFTATACGGKSGQSREGDHEVFDYNVPTPCSLSFAAAKFVVKRIEGTIPVTMYFFKERANIDSYATGCRNVIDQLTKMYGKFPFPEFSVVETDDTVSNQAGFGGASLPGFMLSVSSVLNQPFNLAFYGHEIGHSWWGNVINNAGPDGNYMMDEGMAQYGSLRVVEAIDGPAMAARYRHTGFPGYNFTQCIDGFLEVAAAGLDHRLADMPNEGMGHELADQKGFLVYDQLSRLIGRPALDAAFREVLRKHAYGSVSWTDFKAEIAKQAHQDLGWFWDQWTMREGAPMLDLNWKTEGKGITGVLRQSAPVYRLRVPLRIEYGDGSAEVCYIETNELETPLRIEVTKPVAKVEVDPLYEIPHYTPESLAACQARALLTRANYLRWGGKAAEAKAVYESVLKNLPSPDPYGVEFGARAALGYLAHGSDPAEARKQLELALACPVRLDRSIARCYLYLADAYQKLGDKDRARWAAEACLSYERQQGVDVVSTEARALLKMLG